MSRIFGFGMIAVLLLFFAGCGDKSKTTEVERTPDPVEPEDPPMDITKLPKELQPLAEEIQPDGGVLWVDEVTDEDGTKRTKNVLDLSNTENTDRILAHARAYSSVTHVYLGNSSVTDEGLRFVSEMPSVQYLDLRSSGSSKMQVSDAGLKHLENAPSLGMLYLLGNDSFSHQALDALKEAKGGGDNMLITKDQR